MGPRLLPCGVGGQAPLTALWPPLQEDCHGKIDELFSGKLYLIGIAAIVVAVIMVSGADWLCLGTPPQHWGLRGLTDLPLTPRGSPPASHDLRELTAHPPPPCRSSR